MRNNQKNIFIAVISGIVACIVCAGVIFTFPTNKSNLKGSENKLPNNVGDEIKLGDTACYSNWEPQGDFGNYVSGTCSSVSEPTSSTTGTSYTQCSDNHSPGDSTCPSEYIAYGCHKARTWTRQVQDCPPVITCANKTWTGQIQQIASCTNGTITYGGEHIDAGLYDVTCTGAGGTATKKCSILRAAGYINNVPAFVALRVGETSTLSGITGSGTISYAVGSGSSISLNNNVISGTEVGNSVVVVTAAESKNHLEATKYITVHVTAPESIRCLEKTYNGHSQIIAECPGEITSGEEATNAGPHTVVCDLDSGGHTQTECFIHKATNNSINGTSNVSLQLSDPAYGLNASATYGTVTYSLSGDAVTLSGNMITPVKEGTATITASVAGTDNYNGATATISVTVTDPTPSCWCNVMSSNCEFRTGNASSNSGWVRYPNLTTASQCNSFSLASSKGCFKKSGRYVWGDYGSTEGYTYVVAADEAECNAKNQSGDTNSYVLRCPSSVISFGQSIVCSYETNTDEILADASPKGGDIARASASGSSVTVTAQNTEGTVTVTGKTNLNHSTNGVTITVISNELDANNCEITSVQVDQPIVSLNQQNNNPSNSYYIVHVNFRGLGCSKNTLTVTTDNGTVSPSGPRQITTSTSTGQYSFHIYPNKCKSSTPTAKLSNGKAAVKGSTITVTGDWQKQTGCYQPCGETRCTDGREHDSFLEADLANSAGGPYYSNWNATDKCYNTVWTREGCTPSRQTYNFCCVKNDGTTQSWLTGQTSKTCPEGYTIDNTKNANTCLKTFACYKDSDNAVHWTSSPQASWILVQKPEQECKDEEACFEDTTGARFWGKHYDQIANGYKIITSIKDSDACTNPGDDDACYINDNDIADYRWAKTKPDGYTKVEGITNPKDCQPEACYIDKNKNDFAFGKYIDDENYIPVYKTVQVGNEFKDVLITNKAECTTEVPVGPTDFDVAKLVYVFMAILMACGIAFIYYSSVAKKQTQ